MASSKGTILVTGANGGLGAAIVAHVLKTPELAASYTGLYSVRKAARAAHLNDALKKAPATHEHETVEVDLGSVQSVKRMATAINDRVAKGELPRIRALILNAAYLEHETLTMNDDGYEVTWQVNFLANLVLSLMLLQSMDLEEGRIIVIGSWSHDVDDPRNSLGGNSVYKDAKWQSISPSPEALAKGTWSTPQDDPSWFSGFRRYGASKLCAVMLMHELSARVARDTKLSRIAVMGLDPGGMGSDLQQRGSFMLRIVTASIMIPLLAPIMTWFNPNAALRPTWRSAADVVRACFEMEPPRGRALYLNGSEELETAKDAHDEEKRKALWAYGVKAADLRAGDTVLTDWK